MAEGLVTKGVLDVGMFLGYVYKEIPVFLWPGEGGGSGSCGDGMGNFGLIVVMEIQVVLDNVGDAGGRLRDYVGEVGLLKCAEISLGQGIRKMGKQNKK